MSIWAVIVAGGLVTFLTRLSFIAAEGRFAVPAWFRAMLPFVPVATLTAIIAPALAHPGGAWQVSLSNPRLVAGALAGGFALLALLPATARHPASAGAAGAASRGGDPLGEPRRRVRICQPGVPRHVRLEGRVRLHGPAVGVRGRAGGPRRGDGATSLSGPASQSSWRPPSSHSTRCRWSPLRGFPSARTFSRDASTSWRQSPRRTCRKLIRGFQLKPKSRSTAGCVSLLTFLFFLICATRQCFAAGVTIITHGYNSSVNGLKNSAGGEEPEISSPMAGARKNKASMGQRLLCFVSITHLVSNAWLVDRL